MENPKGKKLKLAVIGAGEGAMPILRRARKLDYVSTLAFGLPDSIGREIADTFIETDIAEIDFIVNECDKHEVAGVIATSESTTEITAYIAHRLHLPGNDVAGGFGAKDK